MGSHDHDDDDDDSTQVPPSVQSEDREDVQITAEQNSTSVNEELDEMHDTDCTIVCSNAMPVDVDIDELFGF